MLFDDFYLFKVKKYILDFCGKKDIFSANDYLEFLHIRMLNKFIDLNLENRNAGYFEILPNN